MNVSVWLDSDQFLQDVQVPIGSSGTMANFTLAELGLSPSTNVSTLTCVAKHGDQEYTDTADLLYLPENPYNGSSVKIDRATGYLKVQYEAGQAWKTVLPFGFYDVCVSSLHQDQCTDLSEHQYHRNEWSGIEWGQCTARA